MKRGQSALEFLTTYGWAFLVILIMIGALSYFGVLEPTRFLPGKCQFGTGFGCRDYMAFAVDHPDVSLQNTLRTVLVNNQGTPVTVLGGASLVTITGLSNICPDPELWMRDSTGALVPITGLTPQDVDWEPNEDRELVILGCNLVEGERAKVAVGLAYREKGSQYDKVVNGEISVSIN